MNVSTANSLAASFACISAGVESKQRIAYHLSDVSLSRLAIFSGMAPGVWHALALMRVWLIGVVSLMMAAMCSSAIPDSSGYGYPRLGRRCRREADG